MNGRHLVCPDGGAVRVTRGKLREVSITALGCDDATAVHITAMQSQGDKFMERTVETPEVKTDDPQAECKRVVAIRNLCGDRYPDIQARAIDGGWDENRTELEILRASRPAAPGVFIRATHTPNSNVIEAALLMRMGRSDLAEKKLGAMALEQADRMGVTNLIDVCRAALYADGQSIPSSRMELVKAALSTYALPVALGNVTNKVLLDAYAETTATWRTFCAVRSVSDFKTNTAIRPTFTPKVSRAEFARQTLTGEKDLAVRRIELDAQIAAFNEEVKLFNQRVEAGQEDLAC